MAQITELEDDLHKLIQEQQAVLHYRIEGTRIRFEKSIREAQWQLKTGFFKWFRQSQFRNIITAPIIYSVIIPMALIDLWVTIYQLICFPLYRVPRVRRSMYIIIDRHHLHYLNIIEQLNCIYCGYVGGVIAYVRAIAARTEQYWYPIKHAHKQVDPHRRYARFADFGQGAGYHKLLHDLREELRVETQTSENSQSAN